MFSLWPGINPLLDPACEMDISAASQHRASYNLRVYIILCVVSYRACSKNTFQMIMQANQFLDHLFLFFLPFLSSLSLPPSLPPPLSPSLFLPPASSPFSSPSPFFPLPPPPSLSFPPSLLLLYLYIESSLSPHLSRLCTPSMRWAR